MSTDNSLLAVSLPLAVQLRIMELRSLGGPGDDHWKSLTEIGQLIAEHGDELMFKSKKKGDTAKIFNQLAQAIAILAFVPGGVTFLGRHYEEAVCKGTCVERM